MRQCTFCSASPSTAYALTSLDGDPTVYESWRREMVPVCPECHDRLRIAGADGMRSLSLDGRWWLGHRTGGPAKILRGRDDDA